MTSYDELPYPSFTFAAAHPDRLAAVATLFGRQPTPPARARVLEIGCAAGGHLMPMAEALPGAQFVGIDLSPLQIAEGERQRQALGLDNLTLRVQDLLTLGPDFGSFDYVIAHGVFSWVPPPVQDGLLALLRDRLAPAGVAYISYNTWPGWHVSMPGRELLLRQVPAAAEPALRLQQARELLRLAAQASPMRWFRDECTRMAAMHDALLHHDVMAEHNAPQWFAGFMARAAAAGLTYLGEAEPGSMAAFQSVRAPWAAAADTVVAREQALDELLCRRFRRTLLCHAARAPAPTPVGLAQLWLRAELRPTGPADAAGQQTFVHRHGGQLTIDHPLARAALLRLGAAAPAALHFATVLAQARADCASRAPEAADQAVLAELVTGCLGHGLLTLHAAPAAVATQPGARPCAARTTRAQAARGTLVANAWHETLDLGREDARLLLTLLDGTRDHAGLTAALAQHVAAGALPAPPGPLAAHVDQLLADLVGFGLLVP